MDQQQQQNVNQASQDWTEAAQQSFKTLADRTVSLQESNLWLTQSFFQQFVEQLQSQTQGNQQAFETLAEESANAYSDFLNSALSFYQQATQVAQSNLQTAGQVAQQGMQAGQVAQQGMQAGQVAQQGMQAGQSAQQGTQAGQSAQQGTQAGQQAAALASGRAPRRALASAASWEAGRPVPISGPDAWAGDKPTASRYTAPDHEAAMQLIYELLSEDSRYDEETWPEIAEALDRDRPSHRKLFVD